MNVFDLRFVIYYVENNGSSIHQIFDMINYALCVLRLLISKYKRKCFSRPCKTSSNGFCTTFNK